MNWAKRFAVTLIGLAAWAVPLAASEHLSLAAASFQEANQAYQAGDYQTAARLYEELTQKEGREAGEVYFNLGNATFKLKQLGRAILNYERARRLMPRHPMVRKNLKYARSLVASRLDAPSNWYLERAWDVLDGLTSQEWQILAAALVAVLLMWVCGQLAVGRGDWLKRLAVPLAAASLAVGLCWVARSALDRTRRGAVVTSAQAEIRYGPSRQEPIAYKLAEGFMVWRVESRDGWARVVLPNNDQGWVEESTVSWV